MAESVHTPIKLSVFSDMQRGKFGRHVLHDMALPANVTLVTHAVVNLPTPIGRWIRWTPRTSGARMPSRFT